MPAPTGKKDACRSLYSQGLSQTAIAKKLNITRNCVGNYKRQDKGTDQDWDKLKADLKGKAPRPKLVTFERPRGDKPKAVAASPPMHDLNHAELAHEIVASTASLIRSGDVPPALGSVLNGLLAWVKFEQELQSEEDALQKVLEKYKSPRELAAKLREMGWGKETA